MKQPKLTAKTFIFRNEKEFPYYYSMNLSNAETEEKEEFLKDIYHKNRSNTSLKNVAKLL